MAMKKGIKSLTVISIFAILLTGCEQFSSSSKGPNTYQITWKNHDGAILEIDEGVIENTLPTYDGPTPSKPSTSQYHYVFSGWTPVVSEATSDREYLATFTEETRVYSVTWKNDDGSVIKTDTNVPYGTVPEYLGVTPTKEQTASTVYSFSNWFPKITAVDGDAVYTATYSETPRKYNITWKNDDGSVIKTDEVAYGETPSFSGDTPTKDSNEQYSFSFKEWSPALSEVKGDATYTATYSSEVRKYTVTWKNYDGSILEIDENVTYGESPSYDGETPVRNKGQGFTYAFTGWSPIVESVHSDQTYYASFENTPTFCFDTWEYELEEGYSLSDINGAPWINPQVTGELEKIKRPSLKDDFYTYVNYDYMKEGRADDNPFTNCYDDIDEAMGALYDGSCASYTTNGDFIYHSIDKIEKGDTESVKTLLNDLDLDQYLSSKEAFLYSSSLFRIVPSEQGACELQYNDGYVNSNISLGTLWLYAYTGVEEDKALYYDLTTSMLKQLGDAFGYSYTEEDYTNISAVEGNLCYRAYYNCVQDPVTVYTYTVNEIPWPEIKSALSNLGLSNNAVIVIRGYYYNLLNVFFNGFIPAYPDTILDMIKNRYMFDSRFFMGLEGYKDLNEKITETGIFFKEENFYKRFSGLELAQRMARCCFPIIDEQTYIQQKGSEETKAQVDALINEILDAYEEMAEDTWLSSTTKKKMIRKIKAMRYACCYSDGHKNFPKVQVNNLDNASISYFLKAYGLAKVEAALNGTLDLSGQYDYVPSYTVNAFYSPRQNTFVILNGLASGLIGNTVEEKYGMLGMVIGHEITHAFDAGGAQYDENGNLNNWWTANDKNAFQEKNDALASFYNNIALSKGYYVRGDDVKEEATADMGGLKVAIELGKKIPGFDFEKFFIAFARMWCRTSMDVSQIPASAEGDFHPFPYLRGNVTLAQFDEFVETFNIQPGDGMYIPEDERVKIW